MDEFLQGQSSCGTMIDVKEISSGMAHVIRHRANDFRFQHVPETPETASE
jgi:hypothetical protein